MQHMQRYFFLVVLLTLVMLVPQTSRAIPPPDLIANLGSQFAQVFSLIAVFLSAGIGVFIQMTQRFWSRLRIHKIWLGLIAIVVVLGALVGTYGAMKYFQKAKTVEFEQEVAAVIDEGIADHAVVIEPEAKIDPNAFFLANHALPIAISNEDFEALQGSDIYVLDAREDEEYALGHYAGSKHVRFADLLAGDWQDLPKDQVVYVLCWSGIRGQELAEFLRDQNIVARYLEDGAKGWVDYGGAWEGEILFSTQYSDERYTGTLSTEEVHKYADAGAFIIDARQADAFATGHITNSLNISIFFTPSNVLEDLFAQVPEGVSVITVCDDYVSCFDAKIAGVKLEKLGHTFLGRYTQPSAY